MHKIQSKFFINITFIVALILVICPPVLAQAASLSSEQNALLRAMQDELARSVAGLRLGDSAKPYFIEYAVEDVEDITVVASFGAVTTRDRSRTRTLRTRVRVGSYTFDNTGFLNPAEFFTAAFASRGLPVEDNYAALRHELWLATDAAYKTAIAQFGRKQAFVQNRQSDDATPDFSREMPTEFIGGQAFGINFPQAEWERRVREMSNVFRDFADVQESNVTLRVRAKCEYLVNSEGTRVREPSTLVSLETRAAVQSSDGTRLSNSSPMRGRSLDDIPAHEAMLKDARRMAEHLTALGRAPVLSDNYAGPVLFEGQAAAEMFAQILAPHLADERPPLTESDELLEALGYRRSGLADRIGRPVLPRAFDVTDDPESNAVGFAFVGGGSGTPTTSVSESHTLFGSYYVDEQGVKAQRVSLIENGILKNFVAGRRPREGSNIGKESDTNVSKVAPASNGTSNGILNGQTSNGHGRAGSYGEPRASVSNLFIEAKTGGKSEAELKRALIEACRAENLPFGIIIRELTTPGNANLVGDADALNSGGGINNQTTLSTPVAVYKVDVVSGAEQLLRVAAASDLSVRSLRRLSAWGDKSHVHHRLNPTFGITGGDIAFGIPVSIIAPSVLIDEMEIRRPVGSRAAPVVLTNPFFKK
ncbi:MAG: metallopeptidase TldD-related protein [Pyrinomonadaceae bacterium MAG19_C2-C3]|nr:metallopeptidase TldD-related protein [Pyrinomonadaceae bacterium MAG19_C2-C3]